MDAEFFLKLQTAVKLEAAVRRARGGGADIEALVSDDMFARILPVLRGEATVTRIMPSAPTVLNLDVPPIFKGYTWRPEDQLPNLMKGTLSVDQITIRTHLSPNQEGEKVIKGELLKAELGTQTDLTFHRSRLLDYCLANPRKIPEELKAVGWVYFWDIFRGAGGAACVRCLRWDGVRWYADVRWLGFEWYAHFPAAVLASIKS